jgi:hypothetical protein
MKEFQETLCQPFQSPVIKKNNYLSQREKMFLCGAPTIKSIEEMHNVFWFEEDNKTGIRA